MRRISTVVLALGCWWLTGARAQEAKSPPPKGPDLDFLEYLGSWAEEDDAWFAIEEWRKDNAWLAIEKWRKDNAEDADKDFENEVESESGDEHESK